MKPRWSGDWPIPTTIHLPGMRIAVRPMPTPRSSECNAAFIYDHGRDTAVILLDMAMPIEVQRYSLLHELQHAVIELVDVLLEKYPDHIKLERETVCAKLASLSSDSSPS